MAANGPREAAAAGQVPVDSASKRNYSAAASSGWQAGVGTEVAAPATPRDRPTSTLLGSVGASASLSEALHPTYGPKAKSRSDGQSTEKRSAAEYSQEVRDYVAEHGRPPRHSSKLVDGVQD